MKSTLSPGARLILSRTATAILGGYLLTTAFIVFLGGVLPLPRAQAVLAGSLASFAIYTAVIVWVFAVTDLRRIWRAMVIAAVALTAIGLLLAGGAA
jgi:hypothetical protein